jgi:hypothetical protein
VKLRKLWNKFWNCNARSEPLRGNFNMLKTIKEIYQRIKAAKDYDWRRVPNPNVRSSRGGRDFW